jgi:flagellar biosynthesis/type III secretory pathway protein FliH
MNNDGKILYLAMNQDATSKHWVELDPSERMRYASAENEVEKAGYARGYEEGLEEGYENGYEAAESTQSSFDDEE